MGHSDSLYLTFLNLQQSIYLYLFCCCFWPRSMKVGTVFTSCVFVYFGNLNEFLKAAIVLEMTRRQDRVHCYLILFTTKSKVCELWTPRCSSQTTEPFLHKHLAQFLLKSSEVAFIQSKKIQVENFGWNVHNYPASEGLSLASH